MGALAVFLLQCSQVVEIWKREMGVDFPVDAFCQQAFALKPFLEIEHERQAVRPNGKPDFQAIWEIGSCMQCAGCGTVFGGKHALV